MMQVLQSACQAAISAFSAEGIAEGVHDRAASLLCCTTDVHAGAFLLHWSATVNLACTRLESGMPKIDQVLLFSGEIRNRSKARAEGGPTDWAAKGFERMDRELLTARYLESQVGPCRCIAGGPRTRATDGWSFQYTE